MSSTRLCQYVSVACLPERHLLQTQLSLQLCACPHGHSSWLKVACSTCRGHMFPVWDVASSPHGLYFASGSADRTARLWSTERAQPLRILAGVARGEVAPLQLVAAQAQQAWPLSACAGKTSGWSVGDELGVHSKGQVSQSCSPALSVLTSSSWVLLGCRSSG